MTDKPIILWTADVKGWAYENRVQVMRRAMPQYEHRVMMSNSVPPCLWKMLCAQADIVVCQGVKWPDRLVQNDVDVGNVVLRLDSMRIDHGGVYYDFFDGPFKDFLQQKRNADGENPVAG